MEINSKKMKPKISSSHNWLNISYQPQCCYCNFSSQLFAVVTWYSYQASVVLVFFYLESTAQVFGGRKSPPPFFNGLDILPETARELNCCGFSLVKPGKKLDREHVKKLKGTQVFSPTLFVTEVRQCWDQSVFFFSSVVWVLVLALKFG